MAVVTIDAKAEIAALQAEADAAEAAPAPASKAPEKPQEAPQKPAEAAADTTPDPDDVEGEDGLTPRQKREFTQAMQRTIGKKHRERREAEEFAAAQYSERVLAERRAQAAEEALAKLKESQPVPRETSDPEAGKPKREAFKTDQEYWDAYVDWRAERKAEAKIKEQREKDALALAEARRAEIQVAAEARVAKALEVVPDFREKVIDQAADIRIPSAITGYLERSELMPELVYHLVGHPEVLEKLAKLPPDEQLVTIGKIESTLNPFEPRGSKAETDGATPSKPANGKEPPAAAEPSQTGSTPSRARSSAPVITPLNGSNGASARGDPADMNIRETIVDWQSRNKANLGLRKRH